MMTHVQAFIIYSKCCRSKVNMTMAVVIGNKDRGIVARHPTKS